ncbi:hypothetical protein ACFL3D_02905 [Candidatus Omnitrophota bacterium]
MFKRNICILVVFVFLFTNLISVSAQNTLSTSLDQESTDTEITNGVEEEYEIFMRRLQHTIPDLSNVEIIDMPTPRICKVKTPSGETWFVKLVDEFKKHGMDEYYQLQLASLFNVNIPPHGLVILKDFDKRLIKFKPELRYGERHEWAIGREVMVMKDITTVDAQELYSLGSGLTEMIIFAFVFNDDDFDYTTHSVQGRTYYFPFGMGPIRFEDRLPLDAKLIVHYLDKLKLRETIHIIEDYESFPLGMIKIALEMNGCDKQRIESIVQSFEDTRIHLRRRFVATLEVSLEHASYYVDTFSAQRRIGLHESFPPLEDYTSAFPPPNMSSWEKFLKEIFVTNEKEKEFIEVLQYVGSRKEGELYAFIDSYSPYFDHEVLLFKNLMKARMNCLLKAYGDLLSRTYDMNAFLEDLRRDVLDDIVKCNGMIGHAEMTLKKLEDYRIEEHFIYKKLRLLKDALSAGASSEEMQALQVRHLSEEKLLQRA